MKRLIETNKKRMKASLAKKEVSCVLSPESKYETVKMTFDSLQRKHGGKNDDGNNDNNTL